MAKPEREDCLTMVQPVVVLLPAHDEEHTVADVVRRAPRDVRGHPVEVVVVDDGSTDRTAAEARAAGATVVRHGANRGLGAAVRTGLAHAVARGAVAVAFLDADGEYAPEELDRLVGPVLDGHADYVAGSRFAGLERRMLPHRWLGNRLLTVAVQGIVRRWGVRGLTDAQSGYRALSPAAAAAAEIVHDFNYAQVLTLDLLGKGFRYAEVPITYGFRRHGQSFVRLGPYLRRVVPAVWRELRAPAVPAAVSRPAPAALRLGLRTSVLDDEAAEAVACGAPAFGVEGAVGS
jgi:glycosyltransferase involved in cell wall biosynthesis